MYGKFCKLNTITIKINAWIYRSYFYIYIPDETLLNYSYERVQNHV